jgi:tetratricopeptide (TPR) repeat protein
VKRLDEAEKVLLASLEAHPGFASTQVHLGRIYLSRGQWTEARSAYRSALAQDPFDPEIHLALLKSAQSLGDAPLADRARSASAVLTGLPADRLPELLARLPGPQSDPSDVAIPRGPAEPPHPPRPAPKKAPKAPEPTATERL